MKIDFLTNDGSPLKVTMKTLWGDSNQVGIGGSELAMLTLCEMFHNAGHDITLYNDPWEQGASPFPQLPLSAFNPSAPRDVLINFRSPNPRSLVAGGYKVWFSCDQFSTGDYKSFGQFMNKIVCISPRHKQFFQETYGLQADYIDLPVRVQDFPTLPKIEHRLIFTSVPARGLSNMRRIWPRVREVWPDATLVITSDYRLWGTGGAGNEQFRSQWLTQKGISFRGAIPRAQYLEELVQAQVFFYQSNYDELFCISAAEAQVAGCRTITSSTGSLPTTNMDIVIPGDGDDGNMDSIYLDVLRTLELSNEKLHQIQVKSINRFSPEKILDQWEKKVFKNI